MSFTEVDEPGVYGFNRSKDLSRSLSNISNPRMKKAPNFNYYEKVADISTKVKQTTKNPKFSSRKSKINLNFLPAKLFSLTKKKTKSNSKADNKSTLSELELNTKSNEKSSFSNILGQTAGEKEIDAVSEKTFESKRQQQKMKMSRSSFATDSTESLEISQHSEISTTSNKSFVSEESEASNKSRNEKREMENILKFFHLSKPKKSTNTSSTGEKPSGTEVGLETGTEASEQISHYTNTNSQATKSTGTNRTKSDESDFEKFDLGISKAHMLSVREKLKKIAVPGELKYAGKPKESASNTEKTKQRSSPSNKCVIQ